MSATHLLDLLATYTSRCPEQRATAARIEALLRAHEDAFLRSCVPGHITGGAWITSPDGRQCVLLHHAKLDRWLQPGGHSDGDVRTERVAEREAREETGLTSLQRRDLDGALSVFDLDVHKIPARADEPEHEHHDVRFLFTADPDEPPICSDESHELLWLPTARLREYTQEESVLRLARKALSWLNPGAETSS